MLEACALAACLARLFACGGGGGHRGARAAISALKRRLGRAHARSGGRELALGRGGLDACLAAALGQVHVYLACLT